MANPINLHNEWKVPFSHGNLKPVATLVPLYDLLFFKKDVLGEESTCVRFLRGGNAQSFRSMGLKLKHDVLVFDANLYGVPEPWEGHRPIDTDSASFSDWAVSGFDIALPRFDPRVKPLFLTAENVEKYLGKGTLPSFESMRLGLNPKHLLPGDFYHNPLTPHRQGFKIFDKDSALRPLNTQIFYGNSVLPSGMGASNTWADYPNPWTVAIEEDWNRGDVTDVISADIIVSHHDRAFQSRFLASDSEEGEDTLAYNGICLNWGSMNVWRNLLGYYNLQGEDFIASLISRIGNNIRNGFEIQDPSIINPVLEYLLKHCYVWVRNAFFADYVDHKDFEQSLNKSAKVIHENLMLTRDGDWKRYDEVQASQPLPPHSRYLARASRPYLPSTTPSVDKIKDTLIPVDLTGNLAKDMAKIIMDADDPHSRIGALPIEPFEQRNPEGHDTPPFTTGALPAPPPVWFDPESRRGGDSYSDFPIMFPKEGNLITDGRLVSPTIDEIWQMLKEIVAGRRADPFSAEEELALDVSIMAGNEEAGYPRGLAGSSDGEDRRTPTDTRPSIRRHGFEDANMRKVVGDPVLIDYELDRDPARYVVRAWVNDPTEIRYGRIAELASLVNFVMGVSSRTEIGNKDYPPAEKPWSLREAEGQVKGLRWNLVNFLNFNHKTAAYNGSVGYGNGDEDPHNRSGGSLYQLHMNYDSSSFQNPNTAYDNRETGALGVIPQGVPPDRSRTPSWAAYLGADGQWHSSKQTLLLPLRNDEPF